MEVTETEELNDQKCILVEFPNENGNIAVGYFTWLTVKEEESVNALIKSGEHVVIRWPANCTVGPFNAKMKKKLRNCKWTPHIVSILGFGDWTSMNMQLKNYLKFDEPNPTKEDRKKYAAKRKGSSSSEEDDKKKELKDTNKRRASAAKKVAGNILETIKKKDQSQSEAQSVTHADSDSTSSSDDDCAISTRTLSTSRKNEIKFTEEIVALKNKNRALKVENLKLKEENQDMKIASAKDLKDIKDTTATILRLLKVNEREAIKKQNVDNLHKERAEDNAQNIVFDGFIDSFDPPINEDSLNDDYAVFKVPYRNKTIDLSQDDNEMNNRVLKTVETKRDEKRQLMMISNENKLKKEDGKYFGDRFLSNQQLEKINDKDGLSMMASELLGLVFDREELRESSLTGKQANANKGKNCPKASTQQLDPIRVADIAAYIYERFGGKNRDNEKLLRAAVRSKCNNAKKYC